MTVPVAVGTTIGIFTAALVVVAFVGVALTVLVEGVLVGYLDSSMPSLPFQGESETSHDAAVAMQPHAGLQREKYFALVREQGAYGLTDREAVRPWLQRSSVCARRNELMDDGRIVKTDRRRNGCAVYVALVSR